MSNVLDVTTQERKIAERVSPNITKALTISDRAGGVQFANAEQVTEFAKMMAVSQIGVRKHLRGNVGACLAIVVQSIEWGVSPYAVANKSYLVNDQIAFESQLVQAVILKRAPIKGRIRFRFEGKGDARVCVASATLADGTGDVEYESPAFGKIQPKNSPLWKNDPDQQHCYYSGRALCRRHFPDVLLGIYAEDEFINGRAVDDAQGSAFAKDVTPKSISTRLDDIAAGGTSVRSGSAGESEVGEDEAASGEILDAPSIQADPEQNAADQDGGQDFTDREKLLHDLHGRIMRGDRVPAMLNALSDEQRALLTDDDRKQLREDGKKFEKESVG